MAARPDRPRELGVRLDDRGRGAGDPLARVGLGLAGVEDVSERAAVPAVGAARAPPPGCPPIRPASGCGRRRTSPTCRRRSRTRPRRRRRGRCGSARPRCPSPPSREPLVYLSFGLVTRGRAHAALPRALPRGDRGARAAAGAVLLTVGEDRDHGELGPLPDNVTVERWVPQDEVLPRAAAVVTHGGHGSTLGALAHGVPMVVLPLFSLDQWFNAEAVARAGAGSRSTASATRAARSTSRRRRRWAPCGWRSSTCSTIRPRAARPRASPGRSGRCRVSIRRRPRHRASVS